MNLLTPTPASEHTHTHTQSWRDILVDVGQSLANICEISQTRPMLVEHLQHFATFAENQQKLAEVGQFSRSWAESRFAQQLFDNHSANHSSNNASLRSHYCLNRRNSRGLHHRTPPSGAAEASCNGLHEPPWQARSHGMPGSKPERMWRAPRTMGMGITDRGRPASGGCDGPTTCYADTHTHVECPRCIAPHWSDSEFGSGSEATALALAKQACRRKHWRQNDHPSNQSRTSSSATIAGAGDPSEVPPPRYNTHTHTQCKEGYDALRAVV